MSSANQLSVFERYGKLQLMVLSQLVTIFAVLYLATLVVFAILRIFTGISIKRIGYFSLKHIVFHPKTGVEVHIGKLGISFHRPTVARPGWISLHVNNCEVVIDTKTLSSNRFPLEESKKAKKKPKNGADMPSRKETKDFFNEHQTIQLVPKSNKQLFRMAQWLLPRLKVIDINFGSLSVTYTDVATLVVGYSSYRMDGRSLNHKSATRTRTVETLDSYELKPGEMKIISRLQLADVYIATSLDDEDPHQVLDSLSLTFSGVLNKEQLSLKELQFGLQGGIVNINCERFLQILAKIKTAELSSDEPQDPKPTTAKTSTEPADIKDEHEDSKPNGESSEAKPNGKADGSSPEPNGSAETAESKSKLEHRREIAWIGMAVLRLVKLIEFKLQSVTVSNVPLKKKVMLHDRQVTVSMSLNDFSFDVRRMSTESPGFKLLFGSPDAVGHQSIFSLTSLKLAIDNGKVREEVVYVPMVTIIAHGNVFSGTLQMVQSTGGANKSLIRLSANVQSPSVNIETHHLKVIEQFFGKKKTETFAEAVAAHKKKGSRKSARILVPFQNLLPHIDCSLLVLEPAMRLVVDNEESMFIVSCSRIGGNLNSTHVFTEVADPTAEPDSYYKVNGTLESSQVEAYYHSKRIPHFGICNFNSTGCRVTAVTRPELSVKVEAWMGNVQFQLLQSEIFEKVRILYLTVGQRSLESRAKSKMRGHKKKSGSPLRKLPVFLTEVQFTLDGAKIAVASDRFRNQKNSLLGLEVAVGRVQANYVRDAESKAPDAFTDGRRIQLEVTELALSRVSEDYNARMEVVDEQAARQALLLEMPSFMLSVMTKTERGDPTMAITYDLPKLVADININQLLAVMVIREVVDVAMGSDLRAKETEKMEVAEEARRRSSAGGSETVVADGGNNLAEMQPDVRTLTGNMGNVRFKVDLPNENRIMLELTDAKFEIARRQNPVLTSKSLRLYSRYPFYRSAWCIVFSFVNVKLQFDVLKKLENKIQAEISTMRINIPFRFKLYRIIDNSITMAKAVRTLMKQTKLSDPLFTLDPKEHSKLPNIPNVFIRTNRLQLQMEDDKFEADLGLIFQVGRVEAEVRFMLEKMFEKQIKDHIRSYLEKLESKEETKPTVRVKEPNDDTPLSEDSEPLTPAESQANSRATSPPSPKRGDSGDVGYFFKRLIDAPLDFGNTHVNHPWHRFWTSSRFKHLRQQEVQWQFEDHPSTGLNGQCSVDEAYERLHRYFERSWYRSINHNRNKQRQGVINRRHDFADDVMDPVTCEEEMIVNYSDAPPIWSLAFMNTDLRITRSEFPDMDSTKQFMHDVGKGVPKDFRYSIFVPLHFDMKAYGGARMDLFDFPLPLLHFPALADNQDPAGTALRIHGNFIIAEQLQTEDRSIRRLFVPVQPVPPSEMNTRSVNVLEIHRTLAPIKMFTDLKFVSRSIWPTRICWCPAYKPAFAALQQGFGGFTKPPIDPSAPVGWWDKIRLVLHARFTFELGDSPLYFLLKGGRSPYELADHNAGFAFVWRKNVLVELNRKDDPKDLIVVSSDTFEFVIPNYLTWESDYLRRLPGERADFWRTDYSAMYESAKVIMRFGNKIQWKLGMMFEQKVPNSLERTNKFMPHWDVHLSMPEYIKDVEHHDCYRGFRSEFMYLALNIHSMESSGFNTVHLTVAAFHHFQTWLGQFKSTLWPPIRQGKLFPGELKPKKAKFSATLRGVQYQLALKPLVLSFVEGRTGRAVHHSYTYSGAKARATSFVLDLHSRREPIRGSKHWKMRMYLGQVDVENIDIRTLLGKVRTSGGQANRKQTRGAGVPGTNSLYEQSIDGVSVRPPSSAPSSLNQDSAMPSSFQPESMSNHEWASIDDFTDVGILLGRITRNDNFEVEVLPFMYIPHFTYMRQTDHSHTKYLWHEGQKYLKFGGEMVHDCMLQNQHPGKIQGGLLTLQRDELKERLADATENMHSLEDQPRSQAVLDRIERAKQIIEQIKKAIGRLDVLIDYGHDAYRKSEEGTQSACQLPGQRQVFTEKDTQDREKTSPEDDAESAEGSLTEHGDKGGSAVRTAQDNDAPVDEGFKEGDEIPERLTAPQFRLPFKSRFHMAESDDLASPTSHYAFDNRYIVYAMHARWNNRVRDRILRLKVAFSYQQKLRHARFYNAISELEELLDNLHSKGTKTEAANAEVKEEAKFDDERVHYNSQYRTADSRLRALIREITDVMEGSELLSSHLVRLITPQIQFISEKNPSKYLQMFARDIDVRVVNIFDEDEPHTPCHKLARRVGCVFDQAAGLVYSEKDQTLFDVGAVSVKSFVLSNADPLLEKHQTPWLSIDQCYNSDVLENFMIVKHTDLGVRLDSPNPLHYSRKNASGCTTTDSGKKRKINIRFDHSRFKDISKACMEDSSIETLITVDLPQLVIAADSVQFFTAYMIATDLLAYHDPIQQSYTDVIDRVVLSTDFSGGSEQMIAQIRQRQDQVNQLYTYRTKYLVKSRGNIRGTSARRLAYIETEYHRATLELMVLTNAFSAGVQQSIRPNAVNYKKISVLVDEVIGHILDERGKSFLDFAMAHLHYSKVSSENRFAMNQVKVGMFQGWNLLPNSLYPEILSPFGTFDKTRPQISVRWTSLEPVGGIPIYDDVSIKVQPLRLQLEQHIVDLLMNFAFPVRKESKDKKLTAQSQTVKDLDDYSSDDNVSDDEDDDDLDLDTELSDTQSNAASDTNSTVTREKVLGRFGKFFKHGTSQNLLRRSGTAPDVDEMMSRASSYMNLIEFKIHAMKLTVSYKGRSRSNLLDLQEVTIPLPEIYYTNKMWNKLDLLNHLKKDILRVLVGHSYAIIGNRFRRHKDKAVVIKGPIEHYNPLRRVRSESSHHSHTLTRSKSATSDQDTSENVMQVTPVYQIGDSRRPSTVPLSIPRQPTRKIDSMELNSIAESASSHKSHNPFKRLKSKIHRNSHHAASANGS
ncbi:hypothetical protein B9G98_00443 [Wickerhamiella sorbophila]|uniref:Protein FMP27, mitochondrial n=1 Tax=Wickerhamiella sorbophila TaxID=45607 RepID=A0A2T0FCT6_9ASCO|nr:hypothetical protein B9G98_00443 [Wickerhamiella sorbophila]PRT52823.1 hypothetical protein B9G98_00443 [Wickerhamiella sorbophila]